MYPTIEASVDEIIGATWSITNGIKVPTTDDITLKNGAKLVDATYVYADLAGSSKLAQTLKREAAAKIIKAYVSTASRILNYMDGEIRSFDGDRVMAIFMGVGKEDRAVRAAMGIHWAVCRVIRPAIEKGWSDGADFCDINHGIGIDSGEALIVRGGVRNHSDLISVGSAPNVAAKLSDIRGSSGSIHITQAVLDALSPDYLTYGEGRRAVWSSTYNSPVVGGRRLTALSSDVYWAI